MRLGALDKEPENLPCFIQPENRIPPSRACRSKVLPPKQRAVPDNPTCYCLNIDLSDSRTVRNTLLLFISYQSQVYCYRSTNRKVCLYETVLKRQNQMYVPSNVQTPKQSYPETTAKGQIQQYQRKQKHCS